MGIVTVIVVGIHLGVATLWLGSMAYSLFVVQPRVARLFPDPMKAEEVYRELGAGNRWRVIALIAMLLGSGVGLALLQIHDGHPLLWWLAVAAKVALLGGASVLFWWVSWRGWPRRIFALRAEIAGEQARFRRVALAMTTLIALAFGLGVLVAHLPR